MDIRFPRELKLYAKNALTQASYDPRKLALIYSGVASGVTLLCTVVNYILSQQIGTTGGLAGLGLRSILSTIQSLLPMISALLLPFWQIGFLKAGMDFSRNEQVSPKTLLAGFRRFGPVLRLFLLRFVFLFGIVLISVNIGSVIFSLTPWSAPIQNIALEVMESGAITEEMIAQIMPALLPLYGIFFAVLAVLAIPFFYRLRMADFILMDKPTGALTAILFSHRLMRGNRLHLFKLDLSFWWYYALGIGSAVIGYLDQILPLLGISLPVSADAAFFLCYGLYVLCQLALAWWAGSYVQTTYAAAFETLIPKEPVAPAPEQPQ